MKQRLHDELQAGGDEEAVEEVDCDSLTVVCLVWSGYDQRQAANFFVAFPLSSRVSVFASISSTLWQEPISVPAVVADYYSRCCKVEDGSASTND